MLTANVVIESIPGRMGMLITLFLIVMNTYISVKAPEPRKVTMADYWFLGNCIPIFMAIFEYGVILSISKYCGGKLFGKSINYKYWDGLFFIVSPIILCVFYGIYFTIVWK